jgi:hypothetical protein
VLKTRPHDRGEVEVDPLTEDEPTTARLDLLSAYTMLGRLQLDGLLAYSVTAEVEEPAPIVEPPALEDDGYYYKEPSEKTWRAA